MIAGGARRLGRSELPVSRIGLGLAALGRPAYINIGHGEDLGADRALDTLRRRSHVVLDAAFAAGIRYFDAARSYGRAEEFLGGWLRRRDGIDAEVTVGSKWGYRYTAAWRIDAEDHEIKDLGVETLRRQLPETREHLGDHLDLYQIHSATLESGVLDDAAVLEALGELRATGVAIGLSVSGARQAAAIDRAITTGAFDVVQATWNLHERSAGPALARAHAAGLGVIVKEAVANGRLAGPDAAPELIRGAADHATTPDAVAIAAVLAQPWADVVLSGASSVAMLESNLRAQDVRVDEALADALRALEEPPEDYWATRSRLPWN